MDDKVADRERMLEEFRRQQMDENASLMQHLDDEDKAAASLIQQLEDEDKAAAEEADELCERLRKLPQSARRKTLENFKGEFADFPPSLFQDPPTFSKQDADKAERTGYDRRRDTMYIPGGGTTGFQVKDASHKSAVGESHKTNVYVDTQYKKIKFFSGKRNPGNGELDYRHWRRAATRIEEDEDMPVSKSKKIILDSLQGRADDIIDFYRDQSIHTILEILDANFKYMVDGDDLLADFYQMIQDEKVLASEFLSNLYIELVEVVKEGGANMGQMPRLLLKQFIRGCREDDLLMKLNLDRKLSDPPAFPFLMSEVRKEEARRTERKLRLRRGRTTQVHAMAASELDQDPQMEALQKKVNKLESLCSSLAANATAIGQALPTNPPKPEKTSPESEGEAAQIQHRLAQVEQQLKVRSSSLFCYRCGIDNHLATDCNNPPNKTLVKLKMEQKREMFRSHPKGRGSEN